MSEREQDTGGQKAHMGITAGDKAAQREGHRQPSKKEEKKQEAVVEAVLFAMGESVELRQLAAAIDGDEQEARLAVERLKQRYDKGRRGIQIIELDGCYQMCTRME